MSDLKFSENGANITVSFPKDSRAVASDGFGPIILGFPTTKITFVQQKPSLDPTEITQDVVMMVQVPTFAIFEFIKKFNESFATNHAGIQRTLQSQVELLNTYIADK